jgi:hypothetical protein
VLDIVRKPHPNTSKERRNHNTKCKTPVFHTDMVAGVNQSVESEGFIFDCNNPPLAEPEYL